MLWSPLPLALAPLADAVEDEWETFRKRAWVALEGRPQLLEVLGISAPS